MSWKEEWEKAKKSSNKLALELLKKKKPVLVSGYTRKDGAVIETYRRKNRKKNIKYKKF